MCRRETVGAVSILATCALSTAFLAAADCGWRSPFAIDQAAAANASGGELFVDTTATEPATPDNLVLRVKLLPTEPREEVIAVAGKRDGFPAEMFDDPEVTIEIAPASGLTLARGSLRWTGALKGNDTAKLTAVFEAAVGADTIIEVTAKGYAIGGRIDADTEHIRIQEKNGSLQIAPDNSQASTLGPGQAGSTN
jgi:hypothetical protein